MDRPAPTIAVMLVALAAACGGAAPSGDTAQRNVVLGAPEDMTSAAGRFDGYMLITHCTTGLGGAAIAVVAGGATPFAFLAAPDSRMLQEQFRASALAELRGVDVRATGFGAGCHGSEPTFHVTLHDWREVDRAVQQLSAWVAREGLRGEIVLFVLPDPVVL